MCFFFSSLEHCGNQGWENQLANKGVAQTGFDLLCEAFKTQADREYFNPHHLLLVVRAATLENSWSFLHHCGGASAQISARQRTLWRISRSCLGVLMSDIKSMCAL